MLLRFVSGIWFLQFCFRFLTYIYTYVCFSCLLGDPCPTSFTHLVAVIQWWSYFISFMRLHFIKKYVSIWLIFHFGPVKNINELNICLAVFIALQICQLCILRSAPFTYLLKLNIVRNFTSYRLTNHYTVAPDSYYRHSLPERLVGEYSDTRSGESKPRCIRSNRERNFEFSFWMEGVTCDWVKKRT